MKIRYSFLPLAAAFGLASGARAEVQPNALFSDGAVLQQNADIPVWGKARDGEKVTVQFDGQSAEATAADGKWMVHLKPHKAGGPFALTMAGENTITINNVLVGEVWVCSGQSNMEFKLNRAANAETETPTANYPNLRMFTVERKTSLQPLSDVTGKWVECSPKTVGGFSAVGYFFGRDIQKATGFPVGMIHTSWGGTPAQAWTSLTGLEKEPVLKSYVAAVQTRMEHFEQASAAYPAALADYQAKMKEWNSSAAGPYNDAVKAWTAENEANKAEGKPLTLRPTPAVPKPVAPPEPDGGPNGPTTLFNGMIAPLIPYGIRGTIWYQMFSVPQRAFLTKLLA